jgi:hypothetical protein
MNRKKILIILGITLVVVVICGAVIMLGGNLHDVIQGHMGM